MSNESFRVSGNSVLIAATSSTGAAATLVSTAAGSPTCYVSNPSTVAVYVAMSQSSAIAAGVPTTSTPCVGLCLPSGQAQAFNAGPDAFWLSAVTSSGSASIFSTPGTGQ